MIKCRICGKEFLKINHTHLKIHNMTVQEYRRRFPDAPLVDESVRKKISQNNGMKNPEVAKKVSELLKGRPSPNRGKPLSPEHRRKISEAHKRLWTPERRRWLSKHTSFRDPKVIEKIRRKNIGRRRDDVKGEKNPAKRPEVRKKISQKLKGRPHPWARGDNNPLRNPKIIEKIKRTRRLKYNGGWYSKEGIKKIARNLPEEFKRPTKPEKLFIQMIKKYSLLFRYVGDGALWIGGMNPDFVHLHENKVVEIFGEYWHRDEDPQERINAFAKYGWNCMVIWEYELKKEESEVLRKVVEWLSS